jgi:hypothetical protein
MAPLPVGRIVLALLCFALLTLANESRLHTTTQTQNTHTQHDDATILYPQGCEQSKRCCGDKPSKVSQERLQDAREMLITCFLPSDTKRDGVLTLAELKAQDADLSTGTDQLVKETLAFYGDADGDQEITIEEFVHMAFPKLTSADIAQLSQEYTSGILVKTFNLVKTPDSKARLDDVRQGT